MKRSGLATFCGIATASLGIMVMLGWILHSPHLITLVPGINMVFNSAVCFFLAGLTLIVIANPSLHFGKPYYAIFLSSIILIIAILSLSQYLFHYQNGIDQLLIKTWIVDQNPFPGRMSINSTIGFILVAIASIALIFSDKKIMAVILQLFIFLIFLISFSTLLGYALQLEFLYDWYRSSQMSFYSGVGLLLLSTGLTAIWWQSNNFLEFFKSKEEFRILLVSSIILFYAIVLAGLTGFAAIPNDNETWLRKYLMQTLQTEVTTFEDAIKRSLQDTEVLMPLIQEKISNPTANKFSGQNLISTMSGLAIYNNKHALVYKKGNIVSNDNSMIAPINLPPIGELGLGMVHKIDTYQLYQIARSQFQKIIALLFLTFFISLLFFYFLIKPLLRKVILSQQKTLQQNLMLEQNEAKIKAIVANIAEGIITSNQAGMILSANAKISEIFGYGWEELEGKLLKILLPKNIRKWYQKNINDYFTVGKSEVVGVPNLEIQAVRKNGEVFPLEMSVTVTWYDHQYVFTAVMRDITERKALENALAKSEKRFHSAFDSAAIGMALVGLDGRWLKVNSALERITGYSEAELLKTNFQSITYSEDLKTDLQYVDQLLKGQIQTYEMEKRYYHKNGQLVWILLSVSLVRDDNNKPQYFISQIQNIGQQKRAEKLLKHQAFHDSLTGLANRAELELTLMRMLAMAKRNQEMLAVLYTDLDFFKDTNDKLGHDIGDLLLKKVANRLKQCVRASDIIARMGGDEFVLVLNEVHSLADVTLVAENIRHLFNESFEIKGHEIKVTISIGISMYPHDDEDDEALLNKADRALYQAKKEGRNTYRFYSALTATRG